MSDDKVIVRPLSSGEFREGLEAGWTGKVLDIDLVDDATTPELDPGALVEVKSGNRLYLGVLQTSHPSRVSVLVEHMLDRDEIEWISDVWG